MILIILGPQGCGKGTQADLLAQKFNWQKLEMGEILRAVGQQNQDVASRLQAGIQFPDWEIKKYAQIALGHLNNKQGLILDGFARSVNQAKDLEELLSEFKKNQEIKVLYIKISDKEAVNRLLKRSQCSLCKKVFIGQDKKNCPLCQGKIVIRNDDNREAILNRLFWFHQNVEPAIEYFRQQGNLIEINGEQSIKEVQKEILEKISV